MSIFPLPVFETELEEYRQKLAAKEEAAASEQKTLVVRFGAMKLVGEYRYDGKVKPGCGSKVVARTHRGTEVTEVLTVTCKNGACAKSITRKEMLEYIDHSGGKDYPFFTKGRVLRIATVDDLNAQAKLEQSRHEMVRRARDAVASAGVSLKIVDAEPILGGEMVTYFFLSEERVDSRPAHRALAALHSCRVDLRQVGARDEARLTADYERCGQHCCCKNFLKVLKPVSMRSAKVQKATLEPLKISGRCGRLMCCLRYEDETYEELRKRLPHRKTRHGTPHGDGIVISTQILTQLALMKLDDGEEVAVPIEELTEPVSKTAPPMPKPGEGRERRGRRDEPKVDEGTKEDRPARRRRKKKPVGDTDRPTESASVETTDQPTKKKKKRRRRKKKAGTEGGAPTETGAPTTETSTPSTGDRGPSEARVDASTPGDGEAPRAKKKRRRRRKKKNPGSGEGGPGADPGASDGGSRDGGGSGDGSGT